MVFVLWLKLPAGEQQLDDVLQLFGIFVLALDSFIIFFKLRGVVDVQLSSSWNS